MGVNLAVDVGYGDTKACVNSKDCFKFPSAVKHEEETWTDYGDDSSAVYNVDGVKYRVGTSAVEDAFSTTSEKFLMNYSFLLVFHALKTAKEKGLIKDVEAVSLAMGVSLANWKVKEEIAKKIVWGVKKLGAEISKVSIYPQGRGVLEDIERKNGNIVVIDIGFNTLDVLNFRNGQPNPVKSKAIPGFGTVKIISDFSRFLTREYGLHLTLQEAKDVFLKRSISINGEVVDLSERIKKEKGKYSEFITGEIEAVFGDDYLKKADIVVFAGGGAYYIDISNMPPNRVLCSPPYEYSNVRGYYRLCFGRQENKGA